MKEVKNINWNFDAPLIEFDEIQEDESWNDHRVIYLEWNGIKALAEVKINLTWTNCYVSATYLDPPEYWVEMQDVFVELISLTDLDDEEIILGVRNRLELEEYLINDLKTYY